MNLLGKEVTALEVEDLRTRWKQVRHKIKVAVEDRKRALIELESIRRDLIRRAFKSQLASARELAARRATPVVKAVIESAALKTADNIMATWEKDEGSGGSGSSAASGTARKQQDGTLTTWPKTKRKN